MKTLYRHYKANANRNEWLKEFSHQLATVVQKWFLREVLATITGLLPVGYNGQTEPDLTR